jgi:hypothetical protein
MRKSAQQMNAVLVACAFSNALIIALVLALLLF